MKRWTSRKFLQSVAAELTGLTTLVYGASTGELLAVLIGAALTVLTAIGYISTEGAIDKVKNSPL